MDRSKSRNNPTHPRVRVCTGNVDRDTPIQIDPRSTYYNSVYTVACSLDAPHSAEIRRLWSRDTGRRAASVPRSFRCCRSRTPAGRPPRWRRNGRCQFIRCENTSGEQDSSNAAARAAWGRPGAAMGKAGRVDVPTTTDR